MLLIIARKFNDIFYAMSLPEWNLYKKKQLIIISNGINQHAFPFQEVFDDVKFYNYYGESFFNILKTIWKINRLNIDKVDTLVFSNPVLVTNQYVIKKTCPREIVMIEDGSLNYSSFKPSKSILKKSLQMVLGINQRDILKKIKSTYLFYPSKGEFFFGRIKKLEFSKYLFKTNSFPLNLNGKKIFVGQPLYNYGYITLQDYNKLVNKVIEKFGIDYYIPHAFSSSLEQIESRIVNISEHNITLEALASKYDFEIFSFGSSVLYTCKTINSNIHSNLILLPKNNVKTYDVGFIKIFCDYIYNL